MYNIHKKYHEWRVHLKCLRQNSLGFSSPRQRNSGWNAETITAYSKGKIWVIKIFINPGTKYKEIIHDYSYFANYNKIENNIQSKDVRYIIRRIWSNSIKASVKLTYHFSKSSTGSSIVLFNLLSHHHISSKLV